jgi:hypothetical protein
MQQFGTSRQHPELKQLVVEASRALALLDATRLEELALSCQALNRDLAAGGLQQSGAMARQAREAAGDMAIFARVLDATLGNMNVINRLRDLRAGRLEYSERPASGWATMESGHGDN